MKTISIICQKGGTGKTTTAAAIGSKLTELGNKVLFIDLDGQCDLSNTLWVDTEGTGIYEVIRHKVPAAAAIINTDYGDIIPGSPLLYSQHIFEDNGKQLASITGKAITHLLREALEPISRSYDYCIIDCSPTLGTLTYNALTAADGVVIPVTASMYSIKALEQLNETINTARTWHQELNIYGVLISMYNARKTVSRECLKQLEEKAAEIGTKVFDTKIRNCAALEEAQFTNTGSIFEYAPKSNAAIDYAALVQELLQA